VGSTMRMR